MVDRIAGAPRSECRAFTPGVQCRAVSGLVAFEPA
jgi:hypothetical protein